MELFFMMTAMLALLGPIAVGRMRCVRISPRVLNLAKSIFSTASHSESVASNDSNTAVEARKYPGKSNSIAAILHALSISATSRATNSMPQDVPITGVAATG